MIIVVCEQFCICQVWGNCIVMLCRHLQLPWQSRFLLKFRTKSVDIIKSTTLRQAYEQQCRQHSIHSSSTQLQIPSNAGHIFWRKVNLMHYYCKIFCKCTFYAQFFLRHFSIIHWWSLKVFKEFIPDINSDCSFVSYICRYLVSPVIPIRLQCIIVCFNTCWCLERTIDILH